MAGLDMHMAVDETRNQIPAACLFIGASLSPPAFHRPRDIALGNQKVAVEPLLVEDIKDFRMTDAEVRLLAARSNRDDIVIGFPVHMFLLPRV